LTIVFSLVDTTKRTRCNLLFDLEVLEGETHVLEISKAQIGRQKIDPDTTIVFAEKISKTVCYAFHTFLQCKEPW